MNVVEVVNSEVEVAIGDAELDVVDDEPHATTMTASDSESRDTRLVRIGFRSGGTSGVSEREYHR
jgi:hypothetical protein